MTTKDKQLLKYCGVSWTVWIVLLITCAASAQVPVADSVVPRLVNYAGVAKDENGKAMKGVFGATFAVYADQDGGSPMWIETQNINANVNGTFSVQLGATKPDGLPVDLFSAGQARWLGVSCNGGAEQPRIALLSVPYALKAGDAQTLGGLPASAFMLAAPPSSSPSDTTASSASADAALPPASSVTGSGTLDFIPLWTSTSAIGNSVLFQTGSGSTAKIGINTTTPGATLDIKGTTNLEGLLTLPAQGTATASGGKSSQPQDLVASSFNSSTNAAVKQTFQWKAETSGNNTATPSGTLNLLFGSGTVSPAETGLKLSSKGLFTFASGQTFPGTGTLTGVTTASGSGLTGGGTSGTLALGLTTSCSNNQVLQWNGSAWACSSAGTGTITGVTAGTDLTGGGTNGSVTLNLNTGSTDKRYAQLGAANFFTGQGAFSGSSNVTPLEAFQNDTADVVSAIGGVMYSGQAGSAAVEGLALAKTGKVFGVEGFAQTLTGSGVYGADGAQSAIGAASGGSSGVWGDVGSVGISGVLGTADDRYGVVGLNNSSSVFPAIYAHNFATSSIAPGFLANSNSPVGIAAMGSGTTYSNNFSTHAGANAVGVVGDSWTSTGIGVWGSTDTGTSVYGSTNTGTGVYGLSTSGSGVIGSSTSQFGVAGTSYGGGVAGVYGVTYNTETGNPAAGVSGEDNSNAFPGAINAGVYGFSFNGYGVRGVNSQGDKSVSAGDFNAGTEATPLTAEGALGGCYIDYKGDLVCSGSKSAAVQLPDNRWVRLYTVESPENWFEDFGSGTLSNGSALIALEPTFRDTVTSSQDYHVFLTPRGECEGLYIAGTSTAGFEVRELHHGGSNIAFDYRIVVRRKGYENIRMGNVTEMREHMIAHRQEIMKQLQHRQQVTHPIAQPMANRAQAEIQLPAPLLANPSSHPNRLPMVIPVPPAPAVTKR